MIIGEKMAALMRKIEKKFREKQIPIAFTKLVWGYEVSAEKGILERTKGSAVEINYGASDDMVNIVAVTNPKVIPQAILPVSQLIVGVGQSLSPRYSTGGSIRLFNIEENPSYDDENLNNHRTEVDKAMKELGISKGSYSKFLNKLRGREIF